MIPVLLAPLLSPKQTLTTPEVVEQAVVTKSKGLQNQKTVKHPMPRVSQINNIHVTIL